MKRAELSPAGRTAWLRLARTRGVGPVTFNELIKRFKTAEDALDALPALAKKRAGARPRWFPHHATKPKRSRTGWSG